MKLSSLYLPLSGLMLGLTLACGGSSGSAQLPIATNKTASTLSYTNPTGTGWRLIKDASSTGSRLVLNLVGPSGTMSRGVGFNVQAPSGVKFSTFANNLPINDTGVYQLQSAGGSGEAVAMTGAVKPTNLLTVGIYQKDRINPAVDSGVALCQIAIQLNGANAGTGVALTIPKAKMIPDDIGNATDDLYTLSQKMKMQDISISVGSISAN